MTDISEVMQTMNKLIEQKTFSADALEGIQDLRKKVQAFETGQKLNEKVIEEKVKKIQEMLGQITSLDNEIARLRAEVGSYKVREAQILASECEQAANKAKAGAYEHFVTLMFQNRSFREKMTDNASGSGYTNDGRPVSQSNYHNIERTIEETR